MLYTFNIYNFILKTENWPNKTQDPTMYPWQWLKLKRPLIPTHDNNVEQLELSYIVGDKV